METQNKIYNSWFGNFQQWLYIETMFSKQEFEVSWYKAIVKTMRYIANNIRYSNGEFREQLKNDLKEVREYFLKNKI